MKFQCDRCKKPYVIADERVRGKILKIRCKSCSAIITVREGIDRAPGVEAAPPAGGPPPVVRAATPRPGTLAPDGPPIDPDLEPEWYLSVGGKQEGPLSLVDAKDWIAGQDADAEVYCWRDGFDDWRLVEEEPFFQKVRRRRQSKLILVPPPPHVEEQQAAERLSSQSIVWSGVSQSTGDLELEIDEPSRVVSFRTAATRDSGGSQPGIGLPGVTSVEDGDLPFAPGLAGPGHEGEAGPAPARRRSVAPLLLVVVLMVLVAVGLVLWVTSRDPDDEGEAAPRSSSPGDLENLGYRVDPATRGSAGAAAAASGAPDLAGKPDAPVRGSRRSPGAARADTRPPARGEAEPEPAGTADRHASLAPLTPDDIIRESSRSEMGFRRCYEQARKKDPFLDVRSLKVDLSVSPAGAVTDVKLSSHADSYLGQCIAARIGKWQLRPSPAGIRSQIPLVFEQR